MVKNCDLSCLVNSELHDVLNLPPDVGFSAVNILQSDSQCLPAAFQLMGSSNRLREFLAGRKCAAMALRFAGYAVDAGILRRNGILPNWPNGWWGSISHTSTVAMAIAAKRSDKQILGLDVEHWIDEKDAYGLAKEIALPNELEVFGGFELGEALTLLFSAKEAIYKALYPSVGRFFDFKAARIFRVDTDIIRAKLCVDWSGEWPHGTEISIRYKCFKMHVVTSVCE